MRLVFVNRFYWPDEPATAQLLADLAEALARRGFAVTVIASRPVASTGCTEVSVELSGFGARRDQKHPRRTVQS